VPEEQFPLLFFPQARLVKPPEAKSTGKPGGGQDRGLPSHERQIERLDARFAELSRVLSNQTLEASQSADGYAPESILVLLTKRSALAFQAAINGIDGMEWLAEADLDGLEPTDDFRDPENPNQDVKGQLLVSFTNQTALTELLRLWEGWKRGEIFGHGQTSWTRIFTHLDAIRPWSLADRLEEFGIVQRWEEDLAKNPEDRHIFEIEFWYRETSIARHRSLEEVRTAIVAAGGRVLGAPVDIVDIRFFAIKAELPGSFLRSWLPRRNEVSGPFHSIGIRYVRPMGCKASALSGDAPCDALEHEVSGTPIVAVLDGLPLENHQLIRSRVQIHDPFALAERYPSPAEQVHGTAMCSIVSWGDLNAPHPLSTPVVCIPIMQAPSIPSNPDDNEESVPNDRFPEDLVHQAVIQLLGSESEQGIAPDVKVINLSVGDPTRPFHRQAGSWARLIDWLSWKHKILFIVAAGNTRFDVAEDDPAPRDLLRMNPSNRIRATLAMMVANRRPRSIHAPAEAINALTVGSVHHDASGPMAPSFAQVDILPDHRYPSPITRHGPGFKRSIKPEILLPGGRILFQNGPSAFVEWRGGGAPGLKAAAPSKDGRLDRASHSHGTSNAAALASNAAGRIGELLLELRRDPSLPAPLLPDAVAPLIKAMLVHGAQKNSFTEEFNRNLVRFKQEGLKVKEFTTDFLGYGVPDIDRVLRCAGNRATVIGFGSIPKQIKGKETLHEYTLPLPVESLKGHSPLRRLTVTLAWLTPVSPRHKDYRQAKLDVKFERELADFESGENNHDQIARGTVWHNVFEAESADLFSSMGRDLRFQVVCSERAGHLEDSIPYGFVVSFETKETISIYEEIRERLREMVSTRVRI
jgi:hypothetical protein